MVSGYPLLHYSITYHPLTRSDLFDETKQQQQQQQQRLPQLPNTDENASKRRVIQQPSPKQPSPRPKMLASPSTRAPENEQPQGSFEDHYTEGKAVRS